MNSDHRPETLQESIREYAKRHIGTSALGGMFLITTAWGVSGVAMQTDRFVRSVPEPHAAPVQWIDAGANEIQAMAPIIMGTGTAMLSAAVVVSELLGPTPSDSSDTDDVLSDEGVSE